MDDGISETFHLDTGSIFKVEKTPEGYLNCHARVARTGDLKYINPDGTTRIERVTPEVLFNRDSYNTLKMKPVTVPEHPPILLDSSNCSQYSKGTTSNIVTIDGSFLGVILTITDETAIKTVESGVTEVSCGYMAKTKPLADGSFQQLSREYNHLAIVPKGRAGKDVRITMDSHDLPIIYDVPPKEKPYMQNVTLKLDDFSSVELPIDIGEKVGAKFKADADTIKTLNAQSLALADENVTIHKRCDLLAAENTRILGTLKTRGYSSVDEVLAKFDALTESLSELKTRLDTAQTVDVSALLKNRRCLERKCEGLLPESFNLDTATDRDLMIGVITKNTKLTDCTDLTDEYIKARFDGVIEAKENTDTSTLALEATNLTSVTLPAQKNMSEIEKLRLDMEDAKTDYLKTFVTI